MEPSTSSSSEEPRLSELSPTSERRARQTRKRLRLMDGERSVFVGEFQRYGSKRYKGHKSATFVLGNIRHVPTQQIVSDHLWFNVGKRAKRLGRLKQGDLVQFHARSRKYPGRQQKWKLTFPSKLKKVSSDGTVLRVAFDVVRKTKKTKLTRTRANSEPDVKRNLGMGVRGRGRGGGRDRRRRGRGRGRGGRIQEELGSDLGTARLTGAKRSRREFSASVVGSQQVNTSSAPPHQRRRTEGPRSLPRPLVIAPRPSAGLPLLRAEFATRRSHLAALRMKKKKKDMAREREAVLAREAVAGDQWRGGTRLSGRGRGRRSRKRRRRTFTLRKKPVQRRN